jgi:sporulation integral membrane protein YtvI
MCIGCVYLIIYLMFIHSHNVYTVWDVIFLQITINKNKLIHISIFILSVVLIFWFIKIDFFGVLVPFLWGVLLAYVLNPIVNVFEKMKLSRTLSIIIVYIILGGVVWLIIKYIVPGLIHDIRHFSKDIPQYSKDLIHMIDSYKVKFDHSGIPKGVQTVIDENITRLRDLAVAFTHSFINSMVSIFSKVFDIALIPVITFYFLKDANDIRRALRKVLPSKYRGTVLSIISDINKVMSQFARSQLIVCLFVGAMTTIALLALKVELAVFIGLIAGIGEIIPYFGPIISMIPAVMLAYMDSPGKALWVLVMMLLIQQIEGNIISPLVMGDSLGVHPLSVMIAIIIGGKYFGLMGMLLAVPVFCVARVLVRHISSYFLT